MNIEEELELIRQRMDVQDGRVFALRFIVGILYAQALAESKDPANLAKTVEITSSKIRDVLLETDADPMQTQAIHRGLDEVIKEFTGIYERWFRDR